MYVRDPWRFAFSELLMASDQPGVCFEFHTPRNARMTEKVHDWLSGAILDGVRYDKEKDEFGLICQKTSRSLKADIWLGGALDDALEGNQSLKPKMDRNGIYWYRQLRQTTKGVR